MSEAWQEKASCKDADASIFFFDEPSAYNKVAYKAYCGVCPVRSNCLDFALVYNLSGVWGGTTDKDRQKVFSSIFIDTLRDDYVESGLYIKELKA